MVQSTQTQRPPGGPWTAPLAASDTQPAALGTPVSTTPRRLGAGGTWGGGREGRREGGREGGGGKEEVIEKGRVGEGNEGGKVVIKGRKATVLQVH